jgi:hypothetical protein
VRSGDPGDVHLRAAVLAALLLAAPAFASNGGSRAPAPPVKGAVVGATPAAAASWRPVAHLRVHVHRGRPAIRLRIVEPQVATVRARIVVLRGSRVVAKLSLGAVRTGRSVRVAWHRGRLGPGHYVVRVHAHDRFGHQLRRPRHARGKAKVVVHAKPKPKPKPPAPPVSVGSVFPVAGPHSYGDGFGVDRGDHRHEGQDIAAARGTPVVAPVAGTVLLTSYQKGGAGYYVVMNADDGRSFFFAHCQTGSVAVGSGLAVGAGTRLCNVGSTGHATGPHLHFEIWLNGWRVNSASHPVDPLPQLRAWDS